jgi:hypothetical protein
MLLSKFSCSASITRLANCCACCATSHPTIKSPQDQKSNKQIAQPWKHWTILIFLDSVQSPSYDTQECRFTNLLQKILAGHHFFMVLCTKLPSLNLLQNGKTVFSTLEAFSKPFQLWINSFEQSPKHCYSVVCLLSLKCDSNSQTVTNIQLGQNKNMSMWLRRNLCNNALKITQKWKDMERHGNQSSPWKMGWM